MHSCDNNSTTNSALARSFLQPATLTSALQINNEQSLFQPEFFAPAISQCFLAHNLSVKPVQTYFVDSVYRQGERASERR